MQSHVMGIVTGRRVALTGAVNLAGNIGIIQLTARALRRIAKAIKLRDQQVPVVALNLDRRVSDRPAGAAPLFKLLR